jgi:hypothetical protein
MSNMAQWSEYSRFAQEVAGLNPVQMCTNICVHEMYVFNKKGYISTLSTIHNTSLISAYFVSGSCEFVFRIFI